MHSIKMIDIGHVPLHDLLCRPMCHKLSINSQNQSGARKLLRSQGFKAGGVLLDGGALHRWSSAESLEALRRQDRRGGGWGYRQLCRRQHPVYLQSYVPMCISHSMYWQGRFELDALGPADEERVSARPD